MFSMTNSVGFADCGADGKMSLTNAMTLMVNCCQFQEYQEQGICTYLRERGIAVFLYSIQIDILRMPEFRENVTTAVKIYGCRSIYGLRRLTIRDAKGEICLIANATGAFFNIAERKAVKVAPDDFGVAFDEAEEMECLPRKIPIPQNGGIMMPPLLVRPSLVDPNAHLSSAHYLSLAEDSLDKDFKFNRVRLEYKHQTPDGEILTPEVFNGANGEKIVNMLGGDGISHAAAEFSAVSL